jgi:UDP-glucose 4-epimerase
MKLLVSGGAGYIGSHFVRHATNEGHTVIVLDSLEGGHQEALPKDVTLYRENIDNKEVIAKICTDHEVEAVVHFAGYIQAGESVVNPQKYIQNNVASSTSLLQGMVEANVKKIIFSSTAAVYGDPETNPIVETHPKRPTNPYGLSKLFFEETLDYFDRKYDIKFIALRYFNASGASLTGDHGEAHFSETHIIPLAIQANEKGTEFHLFGNDYNTPDGTCVRDYIHIEDLASAHVLALKALAGGHPSDYFNVGTGTGYSNKEVLEMIEKQMNKKMLITEKPRREGDPATLIADSNKIQKEFGWKPIHSSLKEIIKTSLTWHTSHPNGY